MGERGKYCGIGRFEIEGVALFTGGFEVEAELEEGAGKDGPRLVELGVGDELVFKVINPEIYVFLKNKSNSL